MPGSSFDSKPNFRALVDHLDDISVWTVPEPGTYGYITDGFEDIWGFPAEELKQDPSRLIESIHPDDRHIIREKIQKPVSEIESETFVARVIHDDNGETRWIQTQQVPIRDEDGNFQLLVGVSTDITEQKRREQELEVLNRIVRHDIRNDMNVILGWADVLRDHVDENAQPHLDKIETTGEHVVELTEFAREFATEIAEEETVELTDIRFRPTVEYELELQDQFHPHVEFSLTGEIPAVTVKANEMLSSVFRNILNNAVQHNDKDDPRVEISFETTAEYVVTRIADNGPGIPDEKKKRSSTRK